MKRALVTTLALLAIAGCKSSDAKSDSTKSGPTATAAASSSPLAVASAAIAATTPADAGAWPSDNGPIKSVDDPRFNTLPLFSKLAVEKNNRPTNTVSSTQVFDAVSKKYGALRNQTQLAGFTIYAGFCEKADTEQAVDIVVCEYHSPEKLEKGKASALKNNVPRREILTVRTSTVSITRFAETKESIDQAKGIAEIVKTL